MHTQAHALTKLQRSELASRIVNAMQEAYEAEGVEGDFDDARRYLANDTSDDELRAEEEKWCKQM
jgi:hypothetical protein